MGGYCRQMLSFSPPSVDLTKQRRLSARWIGTAGSIRARRRYRLDHLSEVIGKGQDTFDAARTAVMNWEMARQGWVSAFPERPEMARGTQVAVVAKLGPLWTASIGMITMIEDTASRYAFSYGTTRDHAAQGEERFEVELHDNGDVVFSITAISRPRKWWAWLGYPLLRLSQARFRRGAVKAIKASVQK